jgi:hypothetical protein
MATNTNTPSRQNPFKKATRKQLKLRLALIGEAKSGKSYSGLALACHLAEALRLRGEPGKVAAIDTEEKSLSKYVEDACECADCRGRGLVFDFDVFEAAHDDDRTPEGYIAKMKDAAFFGYDILLLDSMSHEWEACLRIVDNIKASAKNKWSEPWGEITPRHEAFIQAVLRWPGHVIATMRGKEKFKQEKGSKEVHSLGLQPVMREGVEFEFDVVGYMSRGGKLEIGGARCSALRDQQFNRPGRSVVDVLLNWLDQGKAGAVPADLLDAIRDEISEWARSGKAKPEKVDEVRGLLPSAMANRERADQLLRWLCKMNGKAGHPLAPEPEKAAPAPAAKPEPAAPAPEKAPPPAAAAAKPDPTPVPTPAPATPPAAVPAGTASRSEPTPPAKPEPAPAAPVTPPAAPAKPAGRFAPSKPAGGGA